MIGFPTCPTCGGSKLVGDDYLDHDFDQVSGHLLMEYGEICRVCGTDHKLPCPFCVEGVVITDELVEAGAKALADYRGDPVYSECSKPWSAHDEEATRAVLAAVVAHLKEGTE